MRLLGDGAVRHRAGREPLDDRLDGLDLVERHGRPQPLLEGEQPPQGHQPGRLLVDPPGVLAEHVEPARPGGVLQAEDRLGVEQVRLALAAPLVLAAHVEPPVRVVRAVRRVGLGVPGRDLLRQRVQPDAPELGGRAGEVAVDEFGCEAEGLEHLGAAVGRNSGDPHLAHDLEHALAERLDEVGDGLLGRHPGDRPAADQVLRALHRQIGIDRGRAVPDEQGDVVDLADVARLDQQPDLGAGPLPDQVMVDGARQQQRRDGRQVGSGVAVGQHDEVGATGDGGGDLGEDLLEPGRERLAAPGHAVQAPDRRRPVPGQVAVRVDVDDLGELVVVEHGEGQDELATVGRGRGQRVVLRADGRRERGDELLPDRVQRRVRDLGEELAEVVEEHARAGRQHRHRGVRAHRPDRLGARTCHRRDQQAQLLLGVAEGLLAPHHRRGGVHDVFARRQVLQVDPAGVQPLVVRVLAGEVPLDLLVVDDPAVVGVDEEHPARLQPPLADDPGGIDVQHADLAGQDNEAVVRHPVPGGAQPVAVEHRSDQRTVGEGDGRRPVPRLHEHGVELVERAAGGVHLGVVLPRLGDHHQHGVRQRAATEVEQLEHLVEARGVARVGCADGEQAFQISRDHVADELALPGPHPVAVALHGVDLAVVGDHPERVRERPGGEGVGREPGVHDGELGREAPVGQVREERLELAGGEHPLVDQGACGQ